MMFWGPIYKKNRIKTLKVSSAHLELTTIRC